MTTQTLRLISAPAPLPDRAIEAADLILTRLADPGAVRAATEQATAESRWGFGWGGASLCAGPAGSAVAFAQAVDPASGDDDPWRQAAHQSLLSAVTSTHDVPLLETGLAGGTAGLALAFRCALSYEPRYQPTLDRLEEQLAQQLLSRPDWQRPGAQAKDSDFDVIAGSSGSLAYLGPRWRSTPLIRRAVDRLVEELVWFCSPETAGGQRPWIIPPEHFPLPEYQEDFPYGYVNLGLAHGIPGPLAALSLTASAGYPDPRLPDVIAAVAEYLLAASRPDAHGPNWSYGAPVDRDQRELGGRDPAELGLPVPEAGRTAWCYGAPGVASALLLAAEALGDAELRTRAHEACAAAVGRFVEHRVFASATLCHGAAGLLAVATRFARDGSMPAREALPALIAHLVDEHVGPDCTLGVQDLEQPGVLLDSPSLLSGSAGVALALRSAVRPDLPQPWERALLIS